MWTIEPQFVTEICDLKIESQTFVSHFSDVSTEEARRHGDDDDEGFHEHQSPHHEKKEKKKVHFRNTVIEISKELNETDSGTSHSSEHREYRDVRDRKMTGLGARLQSEDDHKQSLDVERHSGRSHRKHRRSSFNPDGHHSEHHRRRNSMPASAN